MADVTTHSRALVEAEKRSRLRCSDCEHFKADYHFSAFLEGACLKDHFAGHRVYGAATLRRILRTAATCTDYQEASDGE